MRTSTLFGLRSALILMMEVVSGLAFETLIIRYAGPVCPRSARHMYFNPSLNTQLSISVVLPFASPFPSR